MSRSRILFVEDDLTIRTALRDALAGEGHDVVAAADGHEAEALLRAERFDLCVLDIMLPGPSGLELLKQLRDRDADTPVLLLTARGEEGDKVLGLELGADDYVTKPYSARELLARMRAVLRRLATAEADLDDRLLEGGRVTLDIDRHTVAVDGSEISMPLKEFELLEVLMRNAGRVLTRGQLIDRVWGTDYFGDTKTLDVHIKRIRSRIEKNPSDPTMLVTVRGLGYRFES